METPLTPTPASAWKNKVILDGHDLELPSDNVARVKQIAPTAFITSGLIPDPLTAIVRKAIHEKKGLRPEEVNKIAEDPDLLISALEMFDRVLADVMVEPTVEMPPPCDVEVEGVRCDLYANQPVHQNPSQSGKHRYREGPRNPNVLYADQVDMEDKIFIFNWALGGTKQLETFRAELDVSLESLAHGEDPEVPAV
jgi:hypothetical protein